MFKFESFLIGVFLLFSLSAHSSTFTCPVPEIFQGLSCDGSVEVKTLSDLIAYKNNLAQNKGRGKNLIIGFDVSTNTLTISTPCKITIAEKRGITSTADICLHAGLGINFSDSSDLHAKNVRLESNNNIILENHADVKVDNLEMVSLGNTNDSRIHIKENAKVDAKNLLLEAFDRVSLGANSTYKIVENVKLYSRGDDDASVGANTQVSAATFELMAYDQARIANNVSIKADTAIINGKSCSIINKTTTITATNKLGSCFLQSDVKNNFFTVDTNNGFAPLQVTFNASKVKSSSYIFSFGNGDTVTTTSAITKYTYNRSGNFTATLNYLEGKNYKSAGGVQITVKEKPVLPPVASLICSTNNLLANCNALASYDMQGLPLIFTFNYADGFSETNLTGLSSHAYILPGLYIVKLTVSNSMGLSANMTAQIQPMLPPNVLPSLNLNCSSSKPNSLECDSIGSRDADGSIISFQYNFDDNTSDTRADTSKVTHAFLSGGSHLVKLTGVDNDGGVSVVEKSFTVKENTNPVADFNCVSIKPYQVSCNSTSTDIDVAAGNDSLTSYSWNIQNQTITLAANTTLDYNFHSGGEFIVSLTVKDSYGGVGFVSKTISVKENLAPLANFTCANTGVRSIHCISSSSDSDGLIASTSWVLDDGTSLTGISFDYMFLNDQAHTINLLVTDDLGASTSAIQTVHPIQNQPPQGDISASTLSGVVPLTVNFSSQNVLDADGTVTSIAWSFSDGGQSTGATTTHTFNNVGAFTASMILTDNLGTVTTKNVVITTLEPLKEIPGVALKYFENGSTQVDLRSTLTKTQFDLDHAFYTIDGTTTVPILEFYAGTRTLVDLKTYGTHSVTLTVVDIRGQSATTTSVINLLQDPALLKPVVDFRVIQSSVKTAFFNFNRSFNPDVIFGIKNFHIEYGDGASADISTDTFATHTYLAAGTYTAVLTITATQGTKSSLSKTFTITNTDVPIVQPVAAFSYQINSFAQNVSFYNEKSGTPNGSIISYLWDFGDGTSGTGDRLAHFYDPGSYIVTLTVTDSAGLRSSQTQHIIISQTGSDLALNIDCGTATTQIQNCNITALDKFNEINSVRVLWGDDTGQTLTNLVIPGQGIYRVSKKYLTPGLKNISLYVSTVRGDVGTQSITKNIIFPNPIAQIGCNTYGLVLDCWASGSYDPSGGVIKSYTFDPGNGDVGINTTGNFHYVYQQAGSYNVSVKVINTVDLFAVANIQVNVVNLPPIASINCSVNNLLVNCDSSGSYDPEGRPLNFKFDFGDGYIEENNYGFTSHAYTEAGLRTVTLSVTDDAGNVSVATTQVMPLKAPNQLPIAKFNCDSPNPLTVYCYDDGSYDQDGSIVIKKLSFDDGAEEFLNTPTATRHQFATGGEHIITLTVIDNDGGVATLTKSFLVKTNNPPIANFECNTYGPQKLSCYSTSTDPDIGDLVVSFDWDFGDGVIQTGLESTFDHTYGVAPIYTVKLTAHDQFGGSSTVQKDITMIKNQAPVALGTCSFENANLSCNANDSYDSDGTISNYRWEISGEPNQDLKSFTYTLAGQGQRSVKLFVSDDLGKESSVIIGNYEAYSISLIADFGCYQIKKNILKCDASMSRGNTALEYAWNIKGAVFQGKIQEFSFGTDDSIDVQLNVKDMTGIQEQKQEIIKKDEYFEEKSIAQIKKVITSPQKIFYSISDSIAFEISGKDLSLDKGANVILLNDEELEQSQITYINNTININANFVEGLNTFEFRVHDSENKLVEQNIMVFAGSKNVHLSFEGDSGVRTLEFVDANNPEKVEYLNIDLNEIDIENFPKKDFYVHVKNNDWRGGQLVFADATGATLKMSKLDTIPSADNSNFSNGANGWQIDSSFITENNSLKLFLGENGSSSIKRNLKSTNPATKIVTVEYSISSNSPDNYYSISLRNKTTGKEEFKVFSTQAIDTSNDVTLSEGIEVEKFDDTVEFELRLYSKIDASLTVKNKSQLSIISSANAYSISNSLVATVYSINFDNLIHDLVILDRANPLDKISDIPTRRLSVGLYPKYGDALVFLSRDNNGNNVSSNPIRIQYKLVGDLHVSGVSVDFFRVGDSVKFGGQYLKNSLNNQSGSYCADLYCDFNILSQNLPWQFFVDGNKTKLIKAKVKVFLTNGNVFTSETLLKPLVSITAYEPLFSSFRFSGRDENSGGDDWIDPKYMNEYSRLVMLSKDSELGLLYNDFSKMNGNNFFPHKTHDDGNAIDVGITELDKSRNRIPILDDSGVIVIRTKGVPLGKRVSDINVALKIKKILTTDNFMKVIDKIFITFDRDKNNFVDELKSSCLADGRMGIDSRHTKATPYGVVRYEEDHLNHLHIDLNYDLKPLKFSSEVSKVAIGTNFKLILTESYGIVKFQKDDGSFINNRDYAVVAYAGISDNNAIPPIHENDRLLLKEGASSEEFIFYDNTFKVPLVNVERGVGQSMVYSVIYKGNSDYSCFESSKLIGGVNLEIKHYLCQGAGFPITSNISVGELTFSLVRKSDDVCECKEFYLKSNKDYTMYVHSFATDIATTPGVIDDLSIPVSNRIQYLSFDYYNVTPGSQGTQIFTTVTDSFPYNSGCSSIIYK